MVPLSWYLILSAFVFSAGLFAALGRRNAIAVLMGIELMLNAANINLVAFWRFGVAPAENLEGQIFALFVIAVAAAEVARLARHHQPFRTTIDEVLRGVRQSAGIGDEVGVEPGMNTKSCPMSFIDHLCKRIEAGRKESETRGAWFERRVIVGVTPATDLNYQISDPVGAGPFNQSPNLHRTDEGVSNNPESTDLAHRVR